MWLTCGIFMLIFLDTSSQKTYYFSINVTNSASKDAELKWQGISGPEQLTVWKGANVAKEVVVTSSSLPQPFTIYAYEKGTNNVMMLNGIDNVNVPLSLTKQSTFLQITEGNFISFN